MTQNADTQAKKPKKTNLSFKERIERSPTIWLLGTLLAGFSAGIGAYQTVLSITNSTVVTQDRITLLEKDVTDLQTELNAEKALAAQLEKDRVTLEASLVQEKKQTAQLQKDNTALQTNLDAENARTVQLEKDKTALQTNIEVEKQRTAVYLHDIDTCKTLLEKQRTTEYLEQVPDYSDTENDFGVQGNVVFDKATGLMWQQSVSEYSMSFLSAQKYVQQLNNSKFAGYDDWRLPSIEESMTLLEPQKPDGAIYFVDPIFDKESVFWSATKKLESVWVVYFNQGEVKWLSYDSKTYVRAVRTMQQD